MSFGRTSRRKSKKIPCAEVGVVWLRGAATAVTTVRFFTPVALAVCAVSVPQSARAQAAAVGKLSITRQVLVSQNAVTQNAPGQFTPARQNQTVFAGQGIRTLKRSLAEITFRDTSVLRINERTDLVLQDSAALRNIQLRAGVVWVRVARGTNTQIETPSATAVARGTTFVVAVEADGASQLTVLDGRVDMTQGERAVSVGAGETISVAAPIGGGAAVLPPSPSPIAPFQLPEELGGSVQSWWQTFALDSGLQITAGSNAALALRGSPLTEVIQQTAQANLGVTNPKQNGAGLSISIDTRATRSAYRAGNITSLPNYDFRLLDRTDTSLTLLGIGAGLGLIADAAVNKDLTVSTLRGEASAWGFANDPSAIGARGGLYGKIGSTRYRVESNVVRLLSGDTVRTNGKLDSVAVVEQTIGDSVTVFAGRDRFYEGPVFQNRVLSQLIADRYSTFGATVRRGDAAFKAAYLYDANPDVTGAQKGALASLTYKIGGGMLGVHALKVPKLDNGSGLTGSLSYPIAPGQVDFYAEAGRGPDKASLQTYGVYFPGLFQKTDVDLFIEYGEHTGIGRAVSLIAAKDLNQNVNVRAYANVENGVRRTQIGAAAIFRIGSR